MPKKDAPVVLKKKLMSKLRIIPLGGGPGQVTKNMYVYEYGDDAIIIDCGIGFPEEAVYGINVLIPDIDYLKNNYNKKIHGIIISHAHDDHYAGLPYLLADFAQVPIYTSKLTAGFLQEKLSDFGLTAKINIFQENDKFKFGPFSLEFIYVTHSVPDTHHILIHTPFGIIYHGSDFKFDLTPVDGRPPNFQKIANAGQQNVLCMLSDSLGSERSGFSLSESNLTAMFHREIQNCSGRFIVSAVSSSIHRLQQSINVAASHNRQIAFIGRSMEQNSKIAQKLGFLQLPKKSIIHKRKISTIPDNKLCLLIAGSQGQESSSLTRFASGDHPLVKVKSTDKIVISSEPIPGNEQAVARVVDDLSQAGAKVIYSDIKDDLHVSGHASGSELQLLMELIKPKYLYPIGGTFRHLIQYRELALAMGFTKNQVIIPQSAQVIEFSSDGKFNLAETLKLKDVIVDGQLIGDVGPVVLSDRKKMARAGIIIITLPLSKSGNLIGSPQIVTRGFVFVKQSTQLLDHLKREVQSILPQSLKSVDSFKLKRQIEKHLHKIILQLTGREPLILSAIIQV